MVLFFWVCCDHRYCCNSANGGYWCRGWHDCAGWDLAEWGPRGGRRPCPAGRIEPSQAWREPAARDRERGRILVLVHRLAVVVVLSVGFVGQRLDDADVELQRREHH